MYIGSCPLDILASWPPHPTTRMNHLLPNRRFADYLTYWARDVLPDPNAQKASILIRNLRLKCVNYVRCIGSSAPVVTSLALMT